MLSKRFLLLYTFSVCVADKLANEQREKYHLRKEVFELNASLETALEEKKALAESNNKLEEKIKDLESKLAETTSALQEASVVKQSRQKRSLSVDAARPSVSPQDTESSHSPVQQDELLPQQVEVLLSGVQEELNNIKQYMERFDPAKAPETHVPAHQQQGIPDLNNLAEFIKAWKSLKELMCDDEGQVAKSSLHQPQQKTDKKDLETVGGPQDTDSVAKILAENLKLRNQLLLTQNNSVAGILSREREWFKQQICNLAKEMKTNSKDVCEQQDGRTREETNQCSLDKLQHSAKSSLLRDSRSSPFDTNRGAGEKDGVSLEMFVTPPSLLSPRIEAGVQVDSSWNGDHLILSWNMILSFDFCKVIQFKSERNRLTNIYNFNIIFVRLSTQQNLYLLYIVDRKMKNFSRCWEFLMPMDRS